MCDQLVLSSQSSWSQIGWHQGGVLCITNLLVSTSLGSTAGGQHIVHFSYLVGVYVSEK